MSIITFVFAALVVVSAIALLVLSNFPFLAQNAIFPRKPGHGSFVAEVWLDWDICRGSTMYRQRFATQQSAARSAKFYAWVLDLMLPKSYSGTDYYGRSKVYQYEMGIRFGVRKLVDGEGLNFHPVWTTGMPGTSGYGGEHAHSHPFEQNYGSNVSGSTDDFKV